LRVKKIIHYVFQNLRYYTSSKRPAIRMLKQKTMGWTEHVAYKRGGKHIYKLLECMHRRENVQTLRVHWLILFKINSKKEHVWNWVEMHSCSFISKIYFNII
jgi:hypothetical protein